MKTKKQEHQPATLESVWEAFKETDKLIKESSVRFEKELKESRAEFDKRSAEFDKRSAEFDQQMKESRAEFEQQMKKSRAESNRRLKKLEELTGSWANNHGFFAEEYFLNSFENNKRNFFGEKFDRIEDKVKGIKNGYQDEYDILLINGKSIGIVEVKFKAHENDVPKILRKAETFRINFHEYKNHRVYLGLATMVFYPELEQECIKEGIAIVKQIGDTVVINDKHLKTF